MSAMRESVSKDDRTAAISGSVGSWVSLGGSRIAFELLLQTIGFRDG